MSGDGLKFDVTPPTSTPTDETEESDLVPNFSKLDTVKVSTPPKVRKMVLKRTPCGYCGNPQCQGGGYVLVPE